jgi:hypothetical protein
MEFDEGTVKRYEESKVEAESSRREESEAGESAVET